MGWYTQPHADKKRIAILYFLVFWFFGFLVFDFWFFGFFVMIC
jgi:hypothetical protein